MKFTLTIKLGNAEMVSGQHVAAALREVAGRVEMQGDDELESSDAYDRSGRIRDANGNTVGTWAVE